MLANATTHYWLLSDVFGEDPAGITEDRYLAALTELTGRLLQATDQWEGQQDEPERHHPGEHGPAGSHKS